MTFKTIYNNTPFLKNSRAYMNIQVKNILRGSEVNMDVNMGTAYFYTHHKGVND